MTRFPAILLLIATVLNLHSADHIVWDPKARTFDLEVRNMPVEKFLELVRTETGWEVTVESGLDRVVGGKFRNKPAAEAMSLLLGRTRFAFLSRLDGGTRLMVYSGNLKSATQQVGEAGSKAHHVNSNSVLAQFVQGGQRVTWPETVAFDDIPNVYDGQLLTLKVKVHYLKSQFPAINADRELTNHRALIAGANEIWRPAGIRFSMMGNPKSMRLVDRDAERTYADLFKPNVTANVIRQFLPVTLRRLLPDLPDRGKIIHIVIVHTLPPNSAFAMWMRQKGIVIIPQVMYADLVTKGMVWKNGSPFIFARSKVLAHEFGHALSLPHVAIQGNLMGGWANVRDPDYLTASDLNANQVAAARKQAFSGGYR